MTTIILSSLWFGGGTGCLGIVKVDDQYEGIKYYIVCAVGANEQEDQQRIAQWGSTFPKEAGDLLFH